MATLIGYKPGTTLSWMASGGDKVIALANLAVGAVAQSDKSATFLNAAGQLPAFIRWRFESAVNVAAVTGKEIVLHVGQSDSGTVGVNNPGGLNGASGVLASGVELLNQMDRIGSLVLSNARGTNMQRVWLTSYPRLPFQIPVVFNDSGQPLISTAVTHAIFATPYYQYVDVI